MPRYDHPLATRIAVSDEKTITIRGKNLVEDLIGSVSYTEMVFFLIRGRLPDARERHLLDACLVTLMEHGMTPSAIVTRLVADNVPAESQVALGAGLMTVGSVFVGTIEGCARILEQGVRDAADYESYARTVVADHLGRKATLPGFGHRLHKPDDPRAQKLLALGREAGCDAGHVALLEALGRALDAASGRHITINATGAIAALLLEIGMPVEVMRALAVVSRCGGLPGHLVEERRTRSGRRIWRLVDEAIPYEAEG